MKRELIGLGLTVAMIAGCDSAPSQPPPDAGTVVADSASPIEASTDRVALPDGVLDLSSVAVRQAFITMPNAVAATKNGVVLVENKANVTSTDGSTMGYTLTIGSGFKVDAHHVASAGHVVAGVPGKDTLNCGDTTVYTTDSSTQAGSQLDAAVGAAGSYIEDHSTPDLGIVTVQDGNVNFDRLPTIALRPTNAPIAAGTKLYNISYQLTASGVIRNPAANDPAQREPNQTAGILLGNAYGRPNEYVVVTGVGAWGNSENITRPGSSGSPLEFGDGDAAGVVSEADTLSVDAFWQEFGYRVAGATAVSYTLMESVSQGDLANLTAQEHACAPTP